MTQRQWTIIQYALVALKADPEGNWDEDEDGEPPTGGEIDELVQWLSDNAAPPPRTGKLTQRFPNNAAPPRAKPGDREPGHIEPRRSATILGADGKPAIIPERKETLIAFHAYETLGMHVPNVTPAEPDEYKLTVVWTRYHSEDDETVKDKFPGKALGEKLVLQLVEELQEACENMGVAGEFLVLPIKPDTAARIFIVGPMAVDSADKLHHVCRTTAEWDLVEVYEQDAYETVESFDNYPDALACAVRLGEPAPVVL